MFAILPVSLHKFALGQLSAQAPVACERMIAYSQLVNSLYSKLLQNLIDLRVVPLSCLGSRLLLYKSDRGNYLYLKLAERLTRFDPENEAYLRRPPFVKEMHLLDSTGSALDFELTTYPHALFLRTKVGEFAVAFHDENTLAVASPLGVQAGIRLRIPAADGQVTKEGGYIKGLRDLVYGTKGRVTRNELRAENGDVWLDFLIDAHPESVIELSVRYDSSQQINLPPFPSVLQNAEQKWHSWFSEAPRVSAALESQYYYAWWVIGNNMVSPRGHLRYQAMMPSKGHYVGVWNWDAAFHALGIRHLDPELARDQLRTILDSQLDDGMLPDVVYDEGTVERIDHPVPGRVTKPPVMAWAANKLHETDPNIEFLSSIYPSLKRWNAWWVQKNLASRTRLAQYEHPYSSGQDDSPLWDYGLPVLSPDLNSYLSVQMDSLAVIAGHLGLLEESANWNRQAALIVRQMERELYDPESGFFWAKHNNHRIPERTLMNLVPLWTGRLSGDIESRLVGYLTDPQLFWTRFPLSTVACDSPSYDPETMWRGPTWINTNYIFIEALNNSGRKELAESLRKLTLEHLSEHPGLFEYYNSETGGPAGQAVPMFGWTAALFIDLAIQSKND